MEQIVRKRDISDLTYAELAEIVSSCCQPAFRTKQLHEWISIKNVCSFVEMTNLPKTLRAALEEEYCFKTPKEIVKQVSRDGSRKYLLEFSDGVSVETVGMPTRNKLAPSQPAKLSTRFFTFLRTLVSA